MARALRGVVRIVMPDGDGAMPEPRACEGCNRVFGNAGARSKHERACPFTNKAGGGVMCCERVRWPPHMWRVAIWRRTHPLSQISEFGARCLGMEGGRGPGSSLAEAIARMMATVSEGVVDSCGIFADDAE